MSSTDARHNERTPLLSNGNGVAQGYKANGNGSTSASGLAQETALSGNPAAHGGLTDKLVAPARQIGPDLLRGLLMMFMALDHTSMAVGGYAHGQGIVNEAPSTVVERFNNSTAFILRTLSHLCAPGFSMLMGMGLAYWITSRVKRGLSFSDMASHLLTRALAILVLNELCFSLLIPQGLWILNAVLWALAIDYVLIGLLAASIALWLEPALVSSLSPFFLDREVDADAAEAAAAVGMRPPAPRKSGRAETYAFWSINAVLLVLSTVLLWVNVWTAVDHGQCRAAGVEALQGGFLHTAASPFPVANCKLEPKLIFDFMFRTVTCTNFGVISGFPPMGWISFVCFGLVYGRVLVRSPWKSTSVVGFNAVLSVVFAALFVSTRLLGYGNLSTDCLRTPDQSRQAPGSNQYLASLKSFLYMTKYPPSPAYAFGTLAACFALLALLDVAALWHRLARAKKVLLTYGTNALFFYGFHMLTINLVGMVVVSTRLAHPLPWAPDRRGVELTWPYWTCYVGLLIASYFACQWYAGVKSRRGPESVLRFF